MEYDCENVTFLRQFLVNTQIDSIFNINILMNIKFNLKGFLFCDFDKLFHVVWISFLFWLFVKEDSPFSFSSSLLP